MLSLGLPLLGTVLAGATFHAPFADVVLKVLKAAWGWLSHASLWQLVSLGLAIFALAQHFRLADAQHDAASYLKQRDEYAKQLQSISSKRDEQKAVTKETVRVVKEQIRHADDKAKVIEQAPLPGNCRSPKQVLDADI